MSLHQGGLSIDAVYMAGGSSGFVATEQVFTAPGAFSYTVPAGANKIDVVMLGGGAGSNCGGAGGDEGLGGGAGLWFQTTLTVGVEVAPGAVITGTVGAGGTAGTPGLTGNPGGMGQATTIPALSMTAGGGLAPAAGWSGDGRSPGNITWNNRIYYGGAAQPQSGTNSNGLPGNAPGGGACGGRGVVVGSNAAAAGAPGKVWFFAYSVDTSLCHSVWLGAVQVWPTYVGQLSPWYAPTDKAGEFIDVPWPVGANFCDVIGISGGAGGEGTGVGGNPQIGGGAGQWAGKIIPRTSGTFTHDKIRVTRSFEANAGMGGGTLQTAGTNGSRILATPQQGVVQNVAAGLDVPGGIRMGSTTGNRNGGSVTPTFTFNSRTYTLASYGAGAGQGGSGNSKSGASGTRPGGGGQGGDNGGLTGNAAGNGQTGAVIMFWY